jgi:hypothetical protein
LLLSIVNRKSLLSKNTVDALKQEFVRMWKHSGWTKSETARKLGMTAGAVNHLVNPDHSNKPSETTLKLFRLILEMEANPAASFASQPAFYDAPRPDDDEAELLKVLRRFPRAERRRLLEAMSRLVTAEVPRPAGTEVDETSSAPHSPLGEKIVADGIVKAGARAPFSKKKGAA